MEDELDKGCIKISTNELLAFQRDLKEEKELLQKMLAKIDDQVHRLQVEQLHLLGIMNKALKSAKEKSPPHESMSDDQQDSTNRSLDLSVANAFEYFKQEEIEFDDEDEDDM